VEELGLNGEEVGLIIHEGLEQFHKHG
jgi:hypothetical protein